MIRSILWLAEDHMTSVQSEDAHVAACPAGEPSSAPNEVLGGLRTRTATLAA